MVSKFSLPYTYIYIHTHIHIYIHTLIPTYIHTYILTGYQKPGADGVASVGG